MFTIIPWIIISHVKPCNTVFYNSNFLVNFKYKFCSNYEKSLQNGLDYVTLTDMTGNTQSAKVLYCCGQIQMLVSNFWNLLGTNIPQWHIPSLYKVPSFIVPCSLPCHSTIIIVAFSSICLCRSSTFFFKFLMY